MKLQTLCITVVSALILISCGREIRTTYEGPFDKDISKDLQEAFIMAEDGDVIEIPAGTYHFANTLSMEGKNNITIKGAGIDKTFLSFHEQTEGAEGLKIENGDNITIEGLTVWDTKGDCIKIQKVNGLTFKDVRTEWTGEPQETNGAYGFYPVDCDNVVLENCIAVGASDAGIYVGQSRNVLVKQCTAQYNVAGIEIENCINADVTECLALNNTGGILVFDMPGLSQSGRHVRIYNNELRENNTRNFAPEGNIVGEVPAGTGVMILATDSVEVFNNVFNNNRTIGLAVTSFRMVRNEKHKASKHPDFNPDTRAVYIHDNEFNRPYTYPISKMDTDNPDLGLLMIAKFGAWVPDIVYDGFVDPVCLDASGEPIKGCTLCVQNNKGASFVMVDYPNEFKSLSTDMKPFDCSHEPLTASPL